MTKLGIAINKTRCIGCQTCAHACKMQNNVPSGMRWNRVLTEGCDVEDGALGQFPNLSRGYLPLACQHCENPACMDVCPTGATTKDEETGIVMIDAEKCIGCGLCVEACPQGLIRLVDADTTIVPRCSNQDAGPVARNACDVSCITCRMCERSCPAAAITMVDNHAVIDPELCISCGMCAVKCPRGVIVDADGVFTVADFA